MINTFNSNKKEVKKEKYWAISAHEWMDCFNSRLENHDKEEVTRITDFQLYPEACETIQQNYSYYVDERIRI